MNIETEVELHLYTARAMRQSFRYGVHDCTTFVAGALDIITGTEQFKRHYYRQYHDARSALRFVEKRGDFAQHLERLGRMKEVGWKHRQTGDFIVTTKDCTHGGRWQSVWLYLGGDVVYITEAENVTTLPARLIENYVEKVLRWPL